MSTNPSVPPSPSDPPEPPGRERSRAWVEIDASALRQNMAVVRARVGPDALLIAMVKADGYGLGAVRVAAEIEHLVDLLGVATVDEAVSLRRAGRDTRIVVFGPLPPGDESLAARYGLEPTVSDLDGLDRVEAAARAAGVAVPVHLEVDTGMGRAGFRHGAVDGWSSPLRDRLGSDHLRWGSVFTHPHSADEAGAPGLLEQIDRFRRVIRILSPPPDVPRHIANSAAVFRSEPGEREGGHGPAIAGARAGIFMYGGGIGPDLRTPEPVVAVRARVVRVAEVGEGDTVGYGATHVASGPRRWATLSIGYGDGVPRLLSNRGHVILGGRMLPIIGRISMDLTVVDATILPRVVVGDVATVLGRDPDSGREIPLDHVARQARTISWEVLTGLSRRLPRAWTNSTLPTRTSLP